jgi:hypothetical protein
LANFKNGSYITKQRDLLDSGVHLLEIDLLRSGKYTVAPPEEGTRKELGDFDYIISLHKGGTGPVFDIWSLTIRDRLPLLSVPLTEEVNDVQFDLQDVVNRAYLESGVGRTLNYNKDPIPALSPDDAVWADTLLREKGLRTG